jgi:hypothetical protein
MSFIGEKFNTLVSGYRGLLAQILADPLKIFLQNDMAGLNDDCYRAVSYLLDKLEKISNYISRIEEIPDEDLKSKMR